MNSTPVTPCLPLLLVGGVDFNKVKIPNKPIRNLIDNISYPTISFRNSISELFSKCTIHSLWTKYFKFSILPKAKEIHFKILNAVYPSSDLVWQRFGIETNNCVICDDNETTDHLVFHCMYSEALWLDIHDWLYPKVFHLMNFSLKDIIYGCVMDNNEDILWLITLLFLGNFIFTNQSCEKLPKWNLRFVYFIMSLSWKRRMQWDFLV